MPEPKEPPSSQFAFVILAAKRARQLMAGAPMLLGHTRAHKPTRIAVEELQHQLLEYDVPEISDRAEEKGRRKE
ncbi:MAG TPA: DNA-directed RNA polymerase subunit omega [Candidatus Acidoferrales bacterium]|nr:DNA-directed RNA polymerase subunit omega [Candidatus Acidoferrales bacterium]